MLRLLEAEHAALWPEIEAKLADRPNGPQPHILTKARQELLRERVIDETTSATRGGRNVSVWHLRELRGRERHVLDAAARKRLLYARSQSWNSPRKGYPRGLLGPAGEEVLHRSLLVASPYGYKLQNPDGGEVRHLLGSPVEGGPLDSAAFLTTLDLEELPGRPIVLPIEVKNVRHWIYPSSSELFQLLHKAALLQIARPELDFVPVLLCRRRSFFLWAMGKELGFFPIEVAAQYVLPRAPIDFDHFNEVRNELGYTDLSLSEDPSPRLVQALTSSLPREAARYAARWKECGPPLVEHFKGLREFMPPRDQHAFMQDFRDEASHLPGCRVKW